MMVQRGRRRVGGVVITCSSRARCEGSLRLRARAAGHEIRFRAQRSDHPYTTTTPIMMPSPMIIRRLRLLSHTLKSEPRLGTGQVTVWPPPYRPTPLPMGHGYSSKPTLKNSSSRPRPRPKPSNRYMPSPWETETSTNGTRSGASSLDSPTWMTNQRCLPFGGI